MTTQAYLYKADDMIKLPAEKVPISAYTRTYAIGYYYGRAFIPDTEEMPAEDAMYRNTVAFKEGFEAGRKDFEETDLTIQSLFI